MKKHFNQNSIIDNKDEAGYKQYAEDAGPSNSEEKEDTSAIEEIAQMLIDQMTHFVENQDNLGSMTVNERKSVENSLFSLRWPTVISLPDNTAALYMIYRSVRIDRDTHVLNRASCTIVAIDAENTIRYTINAYLTNRFTGTVSVIPIGPRGPVYRESLRYNFNMSGNN